MYSLSYRIVFFGTMGVQAVFAGFALVDQAGPWGLALLTLFMVAGFRFELPVFILGVCAFSSARLWLPGLLPWFAGLVLLNPYWTAKVVTPGIDRLLGKARPET